MSWLGRFTRQLGLGGNATNSRGIARERLSIILAHQRGEILLEGIDMKRLQGEVLECVKKYIAVDDSKPMHLSVRQDGAVDLFEIQVHLAGSSTPSTRHDVKPGGKQLA